MGEQTLVRWNGYPENRHRDGWHWLQHRIESKPVPHLWIAEIAAWSSGAAYSPEGVVELGWRYVAPCLTPTEVATARCTGGDTGRLTCRDPDLNLDALERAHARALTMYRACMVGGAAERAAEWEALLVASGYGWPARPKYAAP